MTTTDTMEDIIRIMREQPDVREEIRRLILTEELLALPAQIAVMHQEQTEMKNDIGILKGLSAFAQTERRYGLIALELGLEPEDVLSPVEIARLSMNDAAQDIDQSELQSFGDSDLIIRARESSGQLRYVAVEVSYTVGHSDIDRAIAHAELITHITGAPAFPVVSGVRAGAVAQARLNSDSIHWHQLPRKTLDPR